jgi:hypothetical protein
MTTYELTSGEISMIETLPVDGEASFAQIAVETRLTPSEVGTMVSNLERRGLVHTRDAIAVSMTEAGHRVHHLLIHNMPAAHRSATATGTAAVSASPAAASSGFVSGLIGTLVGAAVAGPIGGVLGGALLGVAAAAVGGSVGNAVGHFVGRPGNEIRVTLRSD